MNLTKEMTKAEIESYLAGKGDYVKIDHLTRFLNDKLIPLDKRKFVCQKLAEIYEKIKMYSEAAKMSNNVALAATTFAEKMQFHVKEAELYIKDGELKAADEAVKKAITEANTADRNNILNTIKTFYKQQGEAYVKTKKIGSAVKIYEKMLQMNITDAERAEIKDKLMKLYESLGRVKEYFTLKNSR